MANTRISQTSFTRGELAPALHMRTDIKQYAIGLKTLKNGFVHQEGCISNRFGLEYVGEVKTPLKKTRLIPFVFNSEQTYIIEAGENYFRFIQDGGYIVYPADYGITYDGTYNLKSSSENLFTYILADEFTVYTKTEITQDTLCYEDEKFSNEYGKVTSIDLINQTIKIDEDKEKIAQRGEIVEITTPYFENDLQYLKYAQSADILTIVHPSYEPKELARLDHHLWTLTSIIFEPSIEVPSNITAVWTGATGSNTRQYTYLVTAVDKDTLEESDSSETVTATGHREAYWTTSEFFTISWDEVTGASEYNIYRSVNGIYGYLGTSKTTSFTDDNIEPDLSETAPIQRNPFENKNNPSCCAYFQQRKIYGNTVNNPQTLYASQTATSNNFNSSRPLIASDAVDVPLADREVNEIRHLIPFKDLIALTSNSEYKINGSDGKFEANPMPVAIIQSCYGASHVQPIVSGNMVLFVQSGGSVLRDLGYDYLSDSYNGDELSLFASHLFEGKEIIYIAYAKEPYRLVFVIFNDGSMAILTYNKKQELCGWAKEDTDGFFESVACIREGQEDVAYFTIKRYSNPTYEGSFVFVKTDKNSNDATYYEYDLCGTSYYCASAISKNASFFTDDLLTNAYGTVSEFKKDKIIIGGYYSRFIERTKTRTISNAKKGFLVDCGLSTTFTTATKNISGLNHLKNRQVIALADGGVVENLKVSNDGTVTLPKEVKDIVIGLPYEFDFETLGVEGENTHGLKKQINTVSVNVLNSREDFFIVGSEGHEMQLSRGQKSVNDSGYLYSGNKDATPLNTPSDKASIHIKQKYPLPITISAISAIVSIADISDAT